MTDLTRRTLLATAALGAGIAVLPFTARPGHAADTFDTSTGTIMVHPVAHASFVMETPKGTIYCDPVGDPSAYAAFPRPDLILVTHQHGDHFNADTLKALTGAETSLIVNPAVHEMLPEDLKARATSVANGDQAEAIGVAVDAIPAYNITDGRLKFHPKGRDNGYVVTIDEFRVYISGDTEDVPEMRALEDIDLAFVCMNLPFTMTAEAAASAVAEFKPKAVYPYHYRGRDGGTQDPEAFAKMVGEAAGDVNVKLAPWYG